MPRSGRPTGTAVRGITSRSLRRARQNNGFETLASSLPPSRKVLRRRLVVEHLVVHSVSAAHGVPNRPCGGAVRHAPLLSHGGRAVTILPQAGAETLRKVRRTPVGCPPVPQGPRLAGDDLRSDSGGSATLRSARVLVVGATHGRRSACRPVSSLPVAARAARTPRVGNQWEYMLLAGKGSTRSSSWTS